MPTACKEPRRGEGRDAGWRGGPTRPPHPLPFHPFPHMVLIRSGLRDSSQRKWLCTESFCAGAGGGGGSEEKGGKEGKEGRGWGSSTLAPQGALGPPRLSEVRSPEEIHVPPGVAGGHRSPGSRTHQPFLEMLGTRRCRAQGLTSEALGRRRSHPCCARLSPSCTRDGGLKIQSPFIPEWGQDSEWVIYRIIQNLCKNPDTPDPPQEVCFCCYGSPLWAGLLGMGRWAGMRSLVLVSLRISPKGTGKPV